MKQDKRKLKWKTNYLKNRNEKYLLMLSAWIVFLCLRENYSWPFNIEEKKILYPSSYPTFLSTHKENKDLQLCFPLALKLYKGCISKNFLKNGNMIFLVFKCAFPLCFVFFFARTFLDLESYKKTKTNQNLYSQWLNLWASCDGSGRIIRHRITE